MEYTIVSSRDTEGKLQEQVNKLIKEGWRPQGGISVVDTEVAWYFFQAMIKET